MTADRSQDNTPALTRTYVCPECGYDGVKQGEPRGTLKDVNFQLGCPACMTNEGRVVWLVETSDPRAIADAAGGAA